MNDAPTKLSDTARAMLTLAATRPDHLIQPPGLPVAAARAVVRSMLSHALIEEVTTPADDLSPIWRTDDDGTPVSLRATVAGIQAICESEPGAPASSSAGIDAPDAGQPDQELATPDQNPSDGSARVNRRQALHDAARAVLNAWDDDAAQRAGLAGAIERLRCCLAPATTRLASMTRTPRENTKQTRVLTMLRRREGATVTQIAEAMGWAPHTVRGLFGGLKKKGIHVATLERVRVVGANREGAKGSYTIYHIPTGPEV